MADRVPEGVEIELMGMQVLVGAYTKSLDCYRVIYDGPGWLASARDVEQAWREQGRPAPRRW